MLFLECETWSLKFEEENTNWRCWRRESAEYLDLKRKEVTEHWRKLHDEWLNQGG